MVRKWYLVLLSLVMWSLPQNATAKERDEQKRTATAYVQSQVRVLSGTRVGWSPTDPESLELRHSDQMNNVSVSVRTVEVDGRVVQILAEFR